MSSDSSIASLLLTNRLVTLEVEPLRTKEYWTVLERADPGDLLGRSAAEAAALLGDTGLADRVVRLLDATTPFAVERERVESAGICLVSSEDDAYPAELRARLGSAAPPMLYVAGPVDWLHGRLVGVVGSRAVDAAGGEVAREVAKVCAADGIGIVSGAAKGVDQLAMNAGWELGMPVVGVPAEGLVRASRRQEIRSAVGSEELCLASPYAPDAGFSVGNAMGRNKLIYALAEVTVVVASDLDSGGTWAGATEALERGFGSVAVWLGDGAGPGNEALLDAGGRPLHDLADLLTAQEPTEPEAPARAHQQLGLTFEPGLDPDAYRELAGDS